MMDFGGVWNRTLAPPSAGTRSVEFEEFRPVK